MTHSVTLLRDFGAVQQGSVQLSLQMLDQLFDHLVGNGEQP